jgi:hypothetical protein
VTGEQLDRLAAQYEAEHPHPYGPRDLVVIARNRGLWNGTPGIVKGTVGAYLEVFVNEGTSILCRGGELDPR